MNVEGDFVAHDRSDPNDRNGEGFRTSATWKMRSAITFRFRLRDPAKFKSLSERLESILSSHHEDWQEIAKRLRILIDEAKAASFFAGRSARDGAKHRGAHLWRPTDAGRNDRKGCGTRRTRLRNRASAEGGSGNKRVLGTSRRRRHDVGYSSGWTTAISSSSLTSTRSRPIAWALRGRTVGHSGRERDHSCRRSIVPGQAKRST